MPQSTSSKLVFGCRYAGHFFSVRQTLDIYPSRSLLGSKADARIFNKVIRSPLASEESNILSKLSLLRSTSEESVAGDAFNRVLSAAGESSVHIVILPHDDISDLGLCHLSFPHSRFPG